MAEASPRSRVWIFVINNPTKYVVQNIDADESEVDYKMETWRKLRNKCNYIVCQLEKGASGTLHLQGYLEIINPITMAGLKKYMPGAHLEIRRGTQAEAIEYSTKEDTRTAGPFIFGEPNKQGERTDLNELVALVSEGKDTLSIILARPNSLRYIGHLEKLKALMKPKNRGAPKIIWCWGETGTGKTEVAWSVCPNAYCFQENPGGVQWWDGYAGEKEVILDEFAGTYPYRQFLQILDRYPIRVQVKGSSKEMCGRNFIITSNLEPEVCFSSTIDRSPLRRRIDEWAIVGRFERYGTGRRDVRVRYRQRFVGGREGSTIVTFEEEEVEIDEFISICKQHLED